MELIKPNVEIWEQGDTLDDVWKHIARCTRVCYQSEKKDDKETEEKFVKRVILKHKPFSSDKNHLAMLEHGTIYLTISQDSGDFGVCLRLFSEDKYSRIKLTEHALYVTTNLRVIIENELNYYLKHISKLTHHHPRVTVSFTTNIGVTREFNRHRVNSIAEESTRYCNYNKRNDGEIKIGLPAWLLDDEHLPYIDGHSLDDTKSYCSEIADGDDIHWCDMDYYLFSLIVAQYCYNKLICKGWKPQQAREVLPLATKSQLIHTAFIDDWKHFFRLRAEGVSGPPHPNAKLIAEPLRQEFIKRKWL